MKRITNLIQALPGFSELINIFEFHGSTTKLALMRSARLPVLSALHEASKQPILLITQKTDRALSLSDELEIWAPDAVKLLFSEPTSLFYEDLNWGENTRRERLLTLTTLAAAQIPGAHKPETSLIVVAPARAIISKTLPKREFLKVTRSLRIGDRLNMADTVLKWVKMGYEPSSTVSIPGQFARRGGILDIWPPSEPLPVRIELFGDELESFRQFTPGTQRTTEKKERVLIAPAREFLLPDPNIHQDNAFSEFHIPILHPNAGSVLEYLPNNCLILFDDWQAFMEIIEQFEEQALGIRADYVKEGKISEDHPLPYQTMPEVLDAISMHTSIHLGPSSAEPDLDLTFSFSTNPRFGGQLKLFVEHINETLTLGDETIVVSRQAARLQDVLYKDQKSPTFVQGSLTDGFTLKAEKQPIIHMLTDGEIFGWRRPQPRQRPHPQAPPPEANYADLEINTLVVHIDHGIGYFKGLVTREIEGTSTEYLCIEYADNDQLFVPVHQADRVSRYVGARGHRPAITRLSGNEWRRIKANVHKAVEHVAEELLELYAKRHITPGFAFNQDTPWQKELEASFPYIETEDQLQVIQEVKLDMERNTPMDRLICGDVGYGKTEIALRAAFKAVMSGKQVGILVPTTILAQQHFRTFRQRLAAFPVTVEMLSRFRTQAEQRQIVFDLSQGKVDIIIGTHRLIQSDINFKDLGLVVIDEEQRFGVTHKEHLKKLRTEVDVLTLTATPIPRTLYMALTGIRDISTINTPPEERLPIVTHVGPYQANIVRQAILRELERGGQVFFVHNRVQSIAGVQNQLARLIPEARIGVAHGQMAERELENRMRLFTNGDIDVLLSTSIIESGLDIPNANTLIVDRADTFGLAQLYQLRGRVGRGAQRAYAYFFKHHSRSATEESTMRLETLAENTQLGAGYSIAMRDLEIRGAGDFLGTRQHGQIAAVGLNLYTRLLSQAVNQIKKEGHLQQDTLPISAVAYHPIISVDLPLKISIPESYIPDKDLRLRLYRRMADAHSMKEIMSLKNEFIDRFGQMPEPLLNLFYQIEVRTLAEGVGITSVSVENGLITIRFPSLPPGSPPRKYPPLGQNVRTGKNAIWFSPDDENRWQTTLTDALKTLTSSKEG